MPLRWIISCFSSLQCERQNRLAMLYGKILCGISRRLWHARAAACILRRAPRCYLVNIVSLVATQRYRFASHSTTLRKLLSVFVMFVGTSSSKRTEFRFGRFDICTTLLGLRINEIRVGLSGGTFVQLRLPHVRERRSAAL